MSIDFGIRLHRSQFGGISDFPALFHNLLDSLSEQITTIWPDDHLQFGTDNVFEGWTLAAYLAGAFPRFKYGHLVNAQGFRNPALLAKMAAGMQHLTGGRFILGIGAGWHKEEFDAYNLNFAAPGVRIEQLAETIQILRAMWTQSPATYHGKHYRVENAYCTPQPNPPPRILVGTGGNKGIAVAARLGDGWNWDYQMDTFKPRYQLLKQGCEAIGRDVGDLWLTCCGGAHFPKDESDFVLPDPGGEPKLGPTPAHAIEQLRPFIEDYRVSHFQIMFEDQRTIDMFCEQVAPKLVQM